MTMPDPRWETVANKLRKSFDEGLSALTVQLQRGDLDLDACEFEGESVYIEAVVTAHGLREAGYGRPATATIFEPVEAAPFPPNCGGAPFFGDEWDHE